jgi:hypothetical protein
LSPGGARSVLFIFSQLKKTPDDVIEKSAYLQCGVLVIARPLHVKAECRGGTGFCLFSKRHYVCLFLWLAL